MRPGALHSIRFSEMFRTRGTKSDDAIEPVEVMRQDSRSLQTRATSESRGLICNLADPLH